jgi:adenylate cyclase
MSELRQRLVAILAADAAGYSRLMSLDEHATVTALDAARAVFRGRIEAGRGRVIDMAGDSVLAVFETAVGAVQAALAVQQRLAQAMAATPEAQRLRFRIGIHVGDVIEKDDGTVYGDGVNIAARLQTLAEPGGVVVSQAVHGMVARVDAGFEDIGEQQVKNIVQPVRAYRLRAGRTALAMPVPPPRAQPVATGTVKGRRVLVGTAGLLAALAIAGALAWWQPWQRLRSASGAAAGERAVAAQTLAVLPLANLGGDKADDAFVDGLSEELLDVLSRLPELRVAARTSAFQFKGKAVTVQEIGRQLGVDYVVEGTVRRAGPRLRIGAQLVKASDGLRLWSETFDRSAGDALAVQGEIAVQVARALQLKISLTHLSGSGTVDAQALQLYLEGRQALGQARASGALRAEQLFEQALERDPKFARARAALAVALAYHGTADASLKFNAADSPWQQRVRATAGEALAQDPGLAEAHSAIGIAQQWAWQIEASQQSLREALALNPGDPQASRWLVWQQVAGLGRMDEYLREGRSAVDRDPLSADMNGAYAISRIAAGRFDEAVDYADRSLQLDANALTAGVKAWALAGAGRRDEARALVARLNEALGPTTPPNRWVRKAMWLLGDLQGLQQALDRLPQGASTSRSETLVMLGRHDEALALLPQDRTQTRFDALPRYFIDPEWDPVRQDPRFRAMLERFGVAEGHDVTQAWRAANLARAATRP